MTCRHCESTHVVGAAAVYRRHVIGQRTEVFDAFTLPLLPQHVETSQFLLARVVGVEDDRIAVRVGRPESVNGASRQLFFVDQTFEHLLRVAEQLGRFFTHHFVGEDFGVLAMQLPRLKERTPINIFSDFRQPNFFVDRWQLRVRSSDSADTSELRLGHIDRFPVGLESFFKCFFVRHQRHLTFLITGDQFFMQSRVFGQIRWFGFRVHQFVNDTHTARGVQDVDHAVFVLRRDLHRGVFVAGRRSADQKWHLHPCALHLFGHVDHFVQAGRDEAGEPDHVDAVFDGRFEDVVASNHHAEVNDFVIVAAQYHADDVFADVVDVAFDGGQQDFSARAVECNSGVDFLLFHKR